MATSCRSSPSYVFRWRSAAYRRWRRSPSFDGDFGLEDLFREQLESEEEQEEEEDVDDEMGYIEPLLFDEKDEAAWVAENAERMKREAEEKKREAEEQKRHAEEMKLRAEKLALAAKQRKAFVKSIRKYDPKTKALVWTRLPFRGAFFDLDEESSYPPMRNTNKKYQPGCFMLCSANILTFNIVSSDIGFPINVYGTIIARDSLDQKCLYLFRCNRRDSQIIKSEDESLILIGPARGLLLMDFLYFEVDLKIRGERGQDKQLSKGLLDIDGRVVTRLEKNEVRRVTCTSWLSTVEVKYTVVKEAVEATVEIHVLQSYFCGKITAHTSSILDEIVLFEGKAGVALTTHGSRIIQLWRRVVAVSLKDKLVFTIAPRGGTRMNIHFIPALHGADEYECPYGAEKFSVKVTWSVIGM